MFGESELTGVLSDSAVSEGALGGGVMDLAVFGDTLRDGCFPTVGGGLGEDFACSGSGFAKEGVKVSDAFGAVGILAAIAGISEGLDDLDIFPRDIEFFGKDHREGSTDALTHLGAMADQLDRALCGDQDKGARIKLAILHVFHETKQDRVTLGISDGNGQSPRRNESCTDLEKSSACQALGLFCGWCVGGGRFGSCGFMVRLKLMFHGSKVSVWWGYLGMGLFFWC